MCSNPMRNRIFICTGRSATMGAMSRHFADIAYSPTVRDEQRRRLGAPLPTPPGSVEALLGPREQAWIAQRDTAFLATVNADGWPHVQHRGGPPGFLRVPDGRTLALADLGGNRQFVSVGNLRDNDRVALLLLDPAEQRRLKLLGRMQVLEADALAAGQPEGAPQATTAFAPLSFPTQVALIELARQPGAERVLLLQVAAFDWNCSRHITPRWTEQEWRARS
jgi:predicted pyridoxine 5'-phosphate oxidase superfamily flavin-nucleotide-binding protein